MYHFAKDKIIIEAFKIYQVENHKSIRFHFVNLSLVGRKEA